MSTTFRIPDPPADTVNAEVVKATLDRGRWAGCCVCNMSCSTWWSPAPPSGYAPVHEKCVDRLFAQWQAIRASGGTATAPEMSTRKRVGAYARLASAAPATETPVVVLTGQRAAMLPEAFEPGVFWLPGDTADSPWTLLAVTAIGVAAFPSSNSERCREQAARLAKLGVTSERIPVVGTVLVAPDGMWERCWGRLGVAPDRLVRHEGGEQPFAIWRPITRMSSWWTCAMCRETRWPGTWGAFVALRCLACLAKDEADDPRPELTEPSYPGDQHLPEWFTKPVRRLALPKSHRHRRR